MENNYFETIDSIKIGNHVLKEAVLVGTTKFFEEPINSSDYSIACYTASNLIIKANFKAVSHRDTILLGLTIEGKIIIK